MSIFQSTVLNKYIKSLDKKALDLAYNKFKAHFHNPTIQENIRDGKEEQYQGEFLIDLFVNVLGYTKYPNPNYNLTTEYKNVKDAKKADGAIIINDVVKAVIELKGTETVDLGKIETQAFGYKNNQPDCVYIITSNYEKLRFYIDNAIEYVEFNLFTLTEKEFEILYLCLSFIHIEKGLPKKIKEESLSQEDVITKQLYKDYSLFKRELHQSLVALNPQYKPLDLFKKSQKLLDRFLFLFFAEDRQLLPPNSVRLILNQWQQLKDLDENVPLYDRFKKYFGYLNTGFKGKQFDVFAYNGGLFKSDDILDDIKINNELLYTHTLKLSEYDFASEVDVNILGHIFENSLNELDEIKAQLEGLTVDKNLTKRKKEGVFYTPKYITKYIVDSTIGKLCSDKKVELLIKESEYITDKKRQTATRKVLTDRLNQYREWLLQLTICDPACGSGAFLNQALDYLISEHNYIDELQAKVHKASIAFTDIENSILENNLYGVDINEESVEIAKLSLWLRTAQPNRKLNDLNNNIKCGNSLIEDIKVAGEKAFNWQKEFPQVFQKGGFDVVIGNPPYVRQELFKDIKPFLELNYKCYNSVADLYTYFIEKGIKILKKDGYFSFILPNKFLKATYGKEIRNTIKNNISVKTIFDFDDYPVFADATTYPLIFVFTKQKHDSTFTYSEINKKTREFPLASLLKNQKGLPYSIIEDESEWNFFSSEMISVFNKVAKRSIPLSEVVNKQIYLGIKTGKNEAFIIDKETKQLILDEDPTASAIIMPVATGQEIYRYRFDDGEKFLLFTQFDLDIKTLYPTVFKWLQNYEGDLIKRGDKGKNWWNLRPCDYYDKIQQPKIIWRSITNQCGFYLDNEGSLLLSNNNYFIASKSFCLLGILNSRLTFLYLKNICTTLQGGFFDFRRDKVMTIPIPKIFENSALEILVKDHQESIKKQGIFYNSFTRLLSTKFPTININNKLEKWFTLTFEEFSKEISKQKIKLSLQQENEWLTFFDHEKEEAIRIKKVIDASDYKINHMVYKLYDLTDEEIQVVEKEVG